MFLQEYNIMHITQVVYFSYTALYRTTVKTTEAETVIVVSHFLYTICICFIYFCVDFSVQRFLNVQKSLGGHAKNSVTLQSNAAWYFYVGMNKK